MDPRIFDTDAMVRDFLMVTKEEVAFHKKCCTGLIEYYGERQQTLFEGWPFSTFVFDIIYINGVRHQTFSDTQ